MDEAGGGLHVVRLKIRHFVLIVLSPFDLLISTSHRTPLRRARGLTRQTECDGPLGKLILQPLPAMWPGDRLVSLCRAGHGKAREGEGR